jgi:hypothetical protein
VKNRALSLLSYLGVYFFPLTLFPARCKKKL